MKINWHAVAALTYFVGMPVTWGYAGATGAPADAAIFIGIIWPLLPLIEFGTWLA